MDQFNPALFVNQLEGNLNGDIELALSQQQGQQEDYWSISVPTLAIDGELRDYPLTLQATFDANSNLELDIDELLFTQEIIALKPLDKSANRRCH
ncbi:hypothetical protein HORIV_36570 [Vreelandella olivaria]|uniref:Uncharacterized protein n=1 Tax=Vreelandella olivaria TaxID=390919 RepID=A0ABN5WW97_9GAMM|nr:hypothetical protein HORIV_36570 [Halomonas olivaria]